MQGLVEFLTVATVWFFLTVTVVLVAHAFLQAALAAL